MNLFFSWTFKWISVSCTAGGMIAILFWIGKKDAEWSLQLSVKGKGILGFLCALNGLCVLLLKTKSFWPEMLLMGCFAGSLLTAAIMDLWEQMVYRFVWWSAGGALAVLSVLQFGSREMTGEFVIHTVVYIFLQQAVFGHFYGRADCHAFSVCALCMAVLGMDICNFVRHMALTFVGLTVVELARRNVTRGGRLKRPAPLVPYIVSAFWICVIFPALG